jgi:tryptophanyl-tRNA synthetase
MFKAHQVPVGRDQIQHIEMARDIAQSFNHLYGEQLVLPEALIEASVATLPGLDGRKMSKSYDNTMALFAPREQLRKQVAGIVTDSRAPGEAKSTEGSALFEIYQAFASAQETEALRQAYADGIAWGDAKQMLFERIDREVAPMREHYEALIEDPGKIEDILQAGAVKARRLATPFMASLRQSVGLRNLRSSVQATSGKSAKAALPVLKQYREKDGLFYFKLVDPRGRLLLQSLSFESPREAAQAIGQLQTQGEAALAALAGKLSPVDGVSQSDVVQALAQLA